MNQIFGIEEVPKALREDNDFNNNYSENNRKKKRVKKT